MKNCLFLSLLMLIGQSISPDCIDFSNQNLGLENGKTERLFNEKIEVIKQRNLKFDGINLSDNGLEKISNSAWNAMCKLIELLVETDETFNKEPKLSGIRIFLKGNDLSKISNDKLKHLGNSIEATGCKGVLLHVVGYRNCIIDPNRSEIIRNIRTGFNREIYIEIS